MANRRSHDAGEPGGARESGSPVRAAVVAGAAQAPLAANDNKAPLYLRLRRLVLLASTGLAIGWLFWVGFLR